MVGSQLEGGMVIFIMAGVMYLVGVGVLLVLRPSFMFTPDGDWKEFGIGKNDDRYTPFPFWLFCITWAIVSYITMLLLVPMVIPSIDRQAPSTMLEGPRTNTNRRNNRRANVVADSYDDSGSAENPVELPKGYYVLNRKATKLSGVPKYVYLGPEEPSE